MAKEYKNPPKVEKRWDTFGSEVRICVLVEHVMLCGRWGWGKAWTFWGCVIQRNQCQLLDPEPSALLSRARPFFFGPLPRCNLTKAQRMKDVEDARPFDEHCDFLRIILRYCICFFFFVPVKSQRICNRQNHIIFKVRSIANCGCQTQSAEGQGLMSQKRCQAWNPNFVRSWRKNIMALIWMKCRICDQGWNMTNYSDSQWLTLRTSNIWLFQRLSSKTWIHTFCWIQKLAQYLRYFHVTYVQHCPTFFLALMFGIFCNCAVLIINS